jgi:hypothetical protein
MQHSVGRAFETSLQCPPSWLFVTLMMEAVTSSETSANKYHLMTKAINFFEMSVSVYHPMMEAVSSFATSVNIYRLMM